VRAVGRVLLGYNAVFIAIVLTLAAMHALGFV